MPNMFSRAIMALLAFIGLVGVLPISLAELSSTSACPHLGPLPACHLVLLAYGLVLLTVLHRRLWNPWVLLLAWSPIFALAAMGSGMEMLGYDTCPKTAGGLPKCYLSLALAAVLIAPYILHLTQPNRVPPRTN